MIENNLRMIICNITMQVTWNIHDDWLRWMKADYIPAMMREGCFDHYQLSRLRNVPEEDGPTYCIQYYTSPLTSPEVYQQSDDEHFSKRISQRWGTDCLAFRTIMEVIH
jgi:hypothetical protein